MCDTCGTMNSNGGINGYGFGRNVYNLYDCAAEFMEDLDKRVTYEYADDTYHTVTTKGGSYCCFCYGTSYESSPKLERHSMVTEVLPQPANGRFAVVEKCSLCDYCCTRGWMTVLNACAAQLRDTAQQGRRDEYGGDDIEDTAVSGSKRAAAELLKQRKEKATEQPSDPARNGASAPDAHRNESPIIRTKDTEFAETQTPAATPQAQARRAAMQKAAAVKTKDTYIETQVKTSVTEAPEPQRQGQRAFVREQGRKAMRQTRLRQTEQNRRLRNTSPGLGTSETIGTAQNAEDLSHKSIKETDEYSVSESFSKSAFEERRAG